MRDIAFNEGNWRRAGDEFVMPLLRLLGCQCNSGVTVGGGAKGIWPLHQHCGQYLHPSPCRALTDLPPYTSLFQQHVHQH